MQKLQNRGVFGSFTLIEEFPCDLFPFDSDLVSMELSHTFKEFFLENDPTCLYQVAQAIQSLQRLYGKITRVTGRGPAASKVWDLMKRLDREEEDSKPNNPQSSTIEHLFLLDRSIDLLTPLVTQLTYEGLIDEIFGIKNSRRWCLAIWRINVKYSSPSSFTGLYQDTYHIVCSLGFLRMLYTNSQLIVRFSENYEYFLIR